VVEEKHEVIHLVGLTEVIQPEEHVIVTKEQLRDEGEHD
jgi:hypothetical protein